MPNSQDEHKQSTEEREKKKAELLEQLRVKLDIDGTIGTGCLFYLDLPNAKRFYDKIIEIKKYLRENATVPEVNALQLIEFTYLETSSSRSVRAFHVLHPGSTEYAALMIQNKTCFDLFSAANRGRNDFFAKEFLPIVFQQIKSPPDIEVAIYSREHCYIPRPEDKDAIDRRIAAQNRQYGIPVCPYDYPRKRLQTSSSKPEDLCRTILVDNNPASIFPGEEKNALNTWSDVSADDFCLDFNNKNNSITIVHLLLLNNVFGIAGVQDTVIDMTLENGKSIEENLFSLQFIKTKEVIMGSSLFQEKVDIYKPIPFFSPERFKYFERGLKLLQTINPELRFYGHDLLYKLMNEYKKNQEYQNYYTAAMGLC